MTKKRKLIIAALYLGGLAIFVLGLFAEPMNMRFVFIGSAAFMASWVMCLKHAWKNINDNGLWFYFIISAGSIAIPIYLLGAKANKFDFDSAN